MDIDEYAPGPAMEARVEKDGELWTLILVRELRHAPEKVWQALTDPEHLRQWAPYDADQSLGARGPVKLTWVATGRATETNVTRAEAPKLLELIDMRWELEPLAPERGPGAGTRLTLWHRIDRRFVAWGAAGWQICFDVLDRLLSGKPLGRMAGQAAVETGGWHRLCAEYAQQFGVESARAKAAGAQ
jgi:uncharacterized protein YndB with AHSA1/START domain